METDTCRHCNTTIVKLTPGWYHVATASRACAPQGRRPRAEPRTSTPEPTPTR